MAALFVSSLKASSFSRQQPLVFGKQNNLFQNFQTAFVKTTKLNTIRFYCTETVAEDLPHGTYKEGDFYLTNALSTLRNIPYEVDHNSLRNSLLPFGYIVRLNLLKNAEGLSKGQAIVEWGNTDIGQNFLRNNINIGGREIRTFPYRNIYPIFNPNRVLISNLPFKVDQDDFLRELEQYGKIVDAKFLSTTTGRFKGICIVTFSNRDEAQKVIDEKNNSLMGGDHTIYARLDTFKKFEFQQQKEERESVPNNAE